jgi:hypothetical protein
LTRISKEPARHAGCNPASHYPASDY